MGDRVIDLPTDEFPATVDEKEMSSWLFGNPTEQLKKDVSNVWTEVQNLSYIGLLFALFWLPPVDTLLKQIPMVNSPITLVIVRTAVFLLLYWIFMNSNFLTKK